MTFDYEGWLKTAEDRLELLYEQKTEIEEEIARLEEGINGFAPLVKRPYDRKWLGRDTGITDAVREIFKADHNRVFAPTDIKHELLQRGVALTQKNPMATIHQVLSRLADKGTIKPSTWESGRTRYQWDGEKPKRTFGGGLPAKK
jgi:hypothetical protein